MTNQTRKKPNKKLKWAVLTLFFLLISAVLFAAKANGFILLTKKTYLLLCGLLAVLCAVMGFISFSYKHGRSGIAAAVNMLLSLCLIGGTLYLPVMERKLNSIFTASPETVDMRIHVYALTADYLNAHQDISQKYDRIIESNDIQEFRGHQIITQRTSDLVNQQYALDQLKDLWGTETLNINETEGIIDAAEALYRGDGELLILNEYYIPTLEDQTGFENFSQDTRILYTVTKQVEIEKKEPVPEEKEKSSDAFTIYIAGNDTRSSDLSIYGRTDVNLLLTVNPTSKQILITGIPRDAYVPNPALGYGNDKLTHLGNDGIPNTMTGIGEYFGIDIQHYLTVNFVTFKRIIDAVGGIDINNPYYFTTVNGNGHYDAGDFDFEEGNIHLNGDSALAYCRERYNLPNGDYGRNEHQTIVLKGMINKLTSSAILTRFDSVLDSLQGQFITDMSTDQIYDLVRKHLDVGGSYNIVSYHLGGNGAMQGTASMGWGRMLYTVNLFDSQVQFIKDQMNKVFMGETLDQTELPEEDNTTFIPN